MPRLCDKRKSLARSSCRNLYVSQASSDDGPPWASLGLLQVCEDAYESIGVKLDESQGSITRVAQHSSDAVSRVIVVDAQPCRAAARFALPSGLIEQSRATLGVKSEVALVPRLRVKKRRTLLLFSGYNESATPRAVALFACAS